MKLRITYRGPLASCNYDCCYCPFAKTQDDVFTRRADSEAVARFTQWVASREGKDELDILFTPWGEALVRPWYRNALVALSQMPHVKNVVIQTNLSCRTDWLSEADKSSLSIWATFHPSQISLTDFAQKTQELDDLSVSYSVGIVGTKEHKSYAAELRAKLSPKTYLWVNAYKDESDYYDVIDTDFFSDIDPWFELNLASYPSLGQTCNASVSSVSIDGDGNVMPCNFIKRPLGNIYREDISNILNPAFSCHLASCDCYIGYIHLNPPLVNASFSHHPFRRIPVAYFDDNLKQ